ncbi:hypothetical protein [Bradyrhizobium sp.]|uniref:hypothetical protein n=1 Tax=Bradyrhizobium sp. TaxID=376 RepID=UPI001EB9E68A|nr:hypothetical protein [Bradyrhizobium sp.]MBV9984501.1 hypothetical protein [Bradyrhizobium sp.]
MPLLLGDILFQDFEIPDRITGLGGRQALTKHRLIGGKRSVNAMGPDDSDPAWSGRFQGGDAIGRARLIDAMRLAGQAVTLSFGSVLMSVVIEEFTYDYEREWQVLYNIRCYVVNVIIPAVDQSLAALITGDLASLALSVSSFVAAVR